MQEDNLNVNSVEEESSFDFKAVMVKLLIHWKWFVVSIVICLALAFTYLKITAPVYKIQAKVMINDDKKGSYENQLMKLTDLNLMGGNSAGIDNEIEVFLSKSMAKQAVMDMKMYVAYRIEKGLAKRTIYGKYPVNVSIMEEDLQAMRRGLALHITRPDSTKYLINYEFVNAETGDKEKFEKEVATLPYVLNSPIGNLILSKGESRDLKEGEELIVSIVPPIEMAKSCLASLSMSPTSKTTSVANISYLDVNKQRGVDFVNCLVKAYNRENNNDKNIVAMKTEEFIKSRLNIVAKELNDTENEMAEFKRSSGLTNLTGDAQQVLQGSSEYEKKKVEIQTQLNLITYLREYINNSNNELQVIPANVGLADANLSATIKHYNEGVIERNRMLRTATENNPSVVDITTSLNLLSKMIKASVESLYDALTIQKKDISSQAQKFNSKIDDAPTQEKILAGYMRQQEVKSGLYLLLLQKREENSIALAATADNAKIIDAPLANNAPVSPKSSMILMVAFVLGCGIPVVIIYLLELSRYKIEGRNDLEKLTRIPIIGDVAKAQNLKKGQRGIVVKENENDLMTETFRSIRTNLLFMLEGPDNKVVQLTSTTSGEGKTFIASNLAMSLSLLGKKVVLVGLDIRKPRLAEVFGFADRKKGVTTFLAGDAQDKDLLFSQIIPSGVSDYLDILPAGIIPPNPAELLSRKNLDNAIAFLSEKYDYVILDTAPVGLVSDSAIIARVADVTVYVCRADFTSKNDIRFVNGVAAEHKMKNICLVLNDIDMSKRKYGYYYGYGGYSKSYGYGYGHARYGYTQHYGYGQEKK